MNDANSQKDTNRRTATSKSTRKQVTDLAAQRCVFRSCSLRSRAARATASFGPYRVVPPIRSTSKPKLLLCLVLNLREVCVTAGEAG